MISYFKYPIYFLVSIVDNVVNLICSIFRYYPGVDLATPLLARAELWRIYKVIEGRDVERESKAQEALKDIKDISHGKNDS